MHISSELKARMIIKRGVEFGRFLKILANKNFRGCTKNGGLFGFYLIVCQTGLHYFKCMYVRVYVSFKLENS